MVVFFYTPCTFFRRECRSTFLKVFNANYTEHSSSGESGLVASKYCTTPAKYCFGSGQLVSISFKTPFKLPPKVTIGLTLIDTHKDQNVRVNVKAQSITTQGFQILIKPWDVSITYQVHVSWMACP